MRLGALILIIVTFSVAILGFLGVSHMNSYHSRCITETARAADCPQQNAMAFISFNFDTLRSFSMAIVVLAVFLAIFLLFLYLITALLRLLLNSVNFWQQELELTPIVSKNLRGFLALREKSPPGFGN